MNYLRGFIPWIVFAAVSSVDWRWGALAALVSGCFLLVRDLGKGASTDSRILEISTVFFFAVLGAVSFLLPDSGLRHYGGALSLAWLALTAWATLAVGRPFTLGIARLSTPQEFWNTPVFLRVNTLITTARATAFTATAAAVAVCEQADSPVGVRIGCEVVGFLAPATFTRWYPKAVQARRTTVPAQP